jgi:hypothetical protein
MIKTKVRKLCYLRVVNLCSITQIIKYLTMNLLEKKKMSVA